MALITAKLNQLSFDEDARNDAPVPKTGLSDAEYLAKYGITREEWERQNTAKVLAYEAAQRNTGKNSFSDLLNKTPIAQVINNPAVQKVASKTPVGAVANAARTAINANPTTKAAVSAIDKAILSAPSPAVAAGAGAASIKNSAIDAANTRINTAKTTVQDKLAPVQATLQDLLSGARDWYNGAGSQPIVAPQVPGLVSSGAYGNAGTDFSPATIAAQNMNFQGVQDTSQYSPQQAELIQAILQRAQGTGGPSPAELMLASQNQAATNQAMALAASQSGRGLPVAQRQIMQQQALGAQQAAQQAAIMRAQEILQAQQLGSQALQGARGQDIQLAQYNQQQQQAADERNLNARLEAEKTNAANALGWQQSQLSAATTRRGQDIAAQTAALQAEADRQAGLQRRKDEMIKGLISGGVAAYTGGMA